MPTTTQVVFISIGYAVKFFADDVTTMIFDYVIIVYVEHLQKIQLLNKIRYLGALKLN